MQRAARRWRGDWESVGVPRAEGEGGEGKREIERELHTAAFLGGVLTW